MKVLVHGLWLALAACGANEQTTTPSPARVDAQTLQQVDAPPLQKAGDSCPPGRTAPDGSVPLACLDLAQTQVGGS